MADSDRQKIKQNGNDSNFAVDGRGRRSDPVCVLAARRLERRYDSLRDEVGALWRRIEWLCRDTDDRLSVDRLELQQKSKQVRNLWTRLRHVEEALYIEPSDAFKERKEDGDDI